MPHAHRATPGDNMAHGPLKPSIVFLAVALLAASTLPATWTTRNASGDGPVIQFQRTLLDAQKQTREPVVTMASGDVPWIAGHATPDAHSHVWRKTGPEQFMDAEPPNIGAPEDPQPNRDGAVYFSGDGRLYWAAVRDAAPAVQLWASSRTPDGPWTTPFKVGDLLDRPWFFSVGTATYLIATIGGMGAGDVYRVKVYKGTDTGASWAEHATIQDPNGLVGYRAGFPTTAPNGRVVIPLHIVDPTNQQEVGVAISDPDPRDWIVSVVPGRTDVPFGWYWSAVDAASNAYLMWREQYAPNGVILRDELLLARIQAGHTNIEGAFSVADNLGEKLPGAVVGGAEGSLGVTWYERSNAATPWSVQYRPVSWPAIGPPIFSPVVVVDHDVRDAGQPADFADFLSIARKANGQVAIAYNCRADQLVHAELCTLDKANPVIAEQVDGPGV